MALYIGLARNGSGGSRKDGTEPYPVCHSIAEDHVLNLTAVSALTESAGSHVHSHRQCQAPAVSNHPVNARYVSWTEGHNWGELPLYNTAPSSNPGAYLPTRTRVQTWGTGSLCFHGRSQSCSHPLRAATLRLPDHGTLQSVLAAGHQTATVVRGLQDPSRRRKTSVQGFSLACVATYPASIAEGQC